MKRTILLLLTLFCTAVITQANKLPQQDANAMLQKSDKQFFIENKGQWPAEVLYLARMGGHDAWITRSGVLNTYYKLEPVENQEETQTAAHRRPGKFEHKEYNIIGHRVWMKLDGCNEAVTTEGRQKQEGYYNYLISNDPSKHASFVGLYKEAIVKNVYEGIDMRYYFERGHLRYDYIVQLGADPAQISFRMEGSDKT